MKMRFPIVKAPAHASQTDDLRQFRYISEFRLSYERILKTDYGLKLKIIPFKGGSVIESRIVDKKLAETTRLQTVYSLSDAFKKAKIEKTKTAKNMTQGNGIVVKGTSIIVDSDVLYLIKDNSPKEWQTSKVNEDISLIIQDLILTPNLKKS